MKEVNQLEQKSPNLIVLFVVAAIAVYAAMMVAGPRTKIGTAWNSYRVQHGTENYRLDAYNFAISAGIPAKLFQAQINQESGFDPSAVSPAGAIGIAQFMPETARGLGIDRRDPIASLQGAASLMSRYVAFYGSYDKALAAYNGGRSRLDWCIANYTDWLGCMPAETQNYVAAVMRS